jgi:O-antigen ligase
MPNGRIFAVLPRGPSVITSTFVNQNHYVTFAGIGFIAAIGLTLRLYRRRLSGTGPLLRLKIAALIEATGSRGALPLALVFVILTGVVLSGVRGGIIATGVGFFALLVLSARREKHSLRREALLLIFAVVIVVAVFVGFGDVFVGRIEGNGPGKGLYDLGRLRLFLVTILSILSAPVSGFGYGTFAATLPMFHDESLSIWIVWDKAHNSYLEVLQGLGLPFGAMLIACVAVLVWDCVKGARTRKRDATIPAIAAGASFLVGVHALVDFSLQIQAVTLTYMAILGAGVAQARDAPSLIQSRSNVKPPGLGDKQ